MLYLNAIEEVLICRERRRPRRHIIANKQFALNMPARTRLLANSLDCNLLKI